MWSNQPGTYHILFSHPAEFISFDLASQEFQSLVCTLCRIDRKLEICKIDLAANYKPCCTGLQQCVADQALQLSTWKWHSPSLWKHRASLIGDSPNYHPHYLIKFQMMPFLSCSIICTHLFFSNLISKLSLM